jgi:hypothetical protein
VSVEPVGIPFARLSFHGLDLHQVLFVIQAVTQNVSEGSQGTFQAIGCCLFLGLLKCWCLALAILDVTITNVLDPDQYARM